MEANVILMTEGSISVPQVGLAQGTPPGSESGACAHRGSPGTWETSSFPRSNTASARRRHGPGPRGAGWLPTGTNEHPTGVLAAKATEPSGTSEEESEQPIVPLKPGNLPEGPGGGKGLPGTRNRRRDRWQGHRPLIPSQRDKGG